MRHHLFKSFSKLGVFIPQFIIVPFLSLFCECHARAALDRAVNECATILSALLFSPFSFPYGALLYIVVSPSSVRRLSCFCSAVTLTTVVPLHVASLSFLVRSSTFLFNPYLILFLALLPCNLWNVSAWTS